MESQALHSGRGGFNTAVACSRSIISSRVPYQLLRPVLCHAAFQRGLRCTYCAMLDAVCHVGFSAVTASGQAASKGGPGSPPELEATSGDDFTNRTHRALISSLPRSRHLRIAVSPCIVLVLLFHLAAAVPPTPSFVSGRKRIAAGYLGATASLRSGAPLRIV